jgi:FHS family L-fucose permease-like MFS transporter
MATAPLKTSESSGTSAAVLGSGDNAPADLRWFVFALFFIFGGITSLNDVVIPKLKSLFELNYFQAMLVQFAFFMAYFVVSIPAAAVVRRFGYMRTAVAGLVVMTVGCLLFIPASLAGLFVAFLIALFVLAAGITTVQVVTNPLISLLGPARSAHSRLTFAQAFNALGTTVAPFFGAKLILGSLGTVDPSTLSGEALTAYLAAETSVIVNTYLAIAVALAAVAALVWSRRNRLQEARVENVSMMQAFTLLQRPRFAFGALGIFIYVGGEVAIGSLLVNYLMQADTLKVAAQTAGELVTFYWGGAMVGRFIGAWVLRQFPPSLVLATAAACVGVLLITSGLTVGTVSGVALIAIGFFNSIMFPTIFSLASEGLGERAAEGSGVLCVAIVGGAIVPLLAGLLADALSLRMALIVPFFCYVGIAAFGLYCRRHPVEA